MKLVMLVALQNVIGKVTAWQNVIVKATCSSYM